MSNITNRNRATTTALGLVSLSSDFAATDTVPGFVSTTTQTLDGNKTWLDSGIFPAGKRSGSSGNVSDDTIHTISAPNFGVIVIYSATSGLGDGAVAMISYRAQASGYAVTMFASTDWTILAFNGALTNGTGNGTDAKHNLSIKDDGTIIYKNRKGGTTAVVWEFIGTP